MNKEFLAIIAIPLVFTLVAGMIIIAEPDHLAFAKKKPGYRQMFYVVVLEDLVLAAVHFHPLVHPNLSIPS
jgi:hypothetical protein